MEDKEEVFSASQNLGCLCQQHLDSSDNWLFRFFKTPALPIHPVLTGFQANHRAFELERIRLCPQGPASLEGRIGMTQAVQGIPKEWNKHQRSGTEGKTRVRKRSCSAVRGDHCPTWREDPDLCDKGMTELSTSD